MSSHRSRGKERAETPEEANEKARSKLYDSFAAFQQADPSSSTGGHNWLRQAAEGRHQSPEAAPVYPRAESSSAKPRRRRKKRTHSTRLALLGTDHEKLDLGDSSDGDRLDVLSGSYHFESLALHNEEDGEEDSLPGRKNWWTPEMGVGIASVDGHPISTIGFEYSHPDGDVGASADTRPSLDAKGERARGRAEHEAVVLRAEQLERAVIRSQNQIHERDKNVVTAAVAAREATEAAELQFAASAIGMRAKTGGAAAVAPQPRSDRMAMSGSIAFAAVDIEAERIVRLETVLPHMQTRSKLQSISAALDAALRKTCSPLQAASGDLRGEPARSLSALLQGLAAKHYERGEKQGGHAGRRMMDRGVECQRLALAMEERLWNAESGNSSHLLIHRGEDSMDLLVEKDTTFAMACEQACRYWELKPEHWCVADADDIQWMPEMLVANGLHCSPSNSTLHLLQRIISPDRHEEGAEEEALASSGWERGGAAAAVGGTLQQQQQQAVQQVKGLGGVQVQDLGIAGNVPQVQVLAPTKEKSRPKRCLDFCLCRGRREDPKTPGTPKKVKEPKAHWTVRRPITPRSRTVMFRGLVLALLLLSLLSLALDSTLFGMRLSTDYQREIWASNDVCAELRDSIAATPFHNYAQRVRPPHPAPNPAPVANCMRT